MYAILCLCLANSKEVSSQTTPENIVARIYQTIRAGDFVSAKGMADSALADFQKLAPAQLAALHATRALLHDFSGNNQGAVNELTLAAQLNPFLELDPLFYSPGLRAQFGELSKKFQSQTENAKDDLPPGKGEIRYISVPDPRISAAWRSLFIPGWGQFHKQQKKRGYILGGLTILSAAVAVSSYSWEQSAHDKYLVAVDPLEIEAKYEDYDRFYRLRRTFTATTALLWSINFLDAVFTPKSRSKSIAFHPTSSSAIAFADGFRASLQIQF